MKKNLLFIVILFFLFLLMYYDNKGKPLEFQWKATYSMHDKQPYGCFVLDELIGASWIEDCYHSYDDISSLYSYRELDECNLLIICNSFKPTEIQLEDLKDYITSGGCAFIAAENFSVGMQDSLNFRIEKKFSFPINLSKEHEFTTISLTNIKDSLISVPESMVTAYLADKNIYTKDPFRDYKIIARNSEGLPLILEIEIGKGQLYLCTTPLLFTNYAVLNASLNPYLRKAITPLQGKDLLRTEYYEVGRNGEESASLLRYLLNQPSLKWACYVTFVLVGLFMIFTAKRKQKAIPLVKKPTNKMLEFVRSICTLYLKQNNNADILRKKYIYWGEELRRLYGIDVINEPHDRDFIHKFSAKTGIPESEARYLLLELDAIQYDTALSDEELMNLIKKMNID
ncbi:hypothetical protein LJB92_01235 [Bacteroidales bacterium OttesenSCG-928-M06]|nr:hypothetical protein [Bacteroidales bacterium OttesenSCG-928-M06]